MPKRSYINPESVVAPPGNFSWVVQADKTLYLAGQVGIDKDGKTVDPRDAGAQVKQALYNIDATLRELGGTLDNIVRTTTYVVGRENLDSSPRRAQGGHGRGPDDQQAGQHAPGDIGPRGRRLAGRDRVHRGPGLKGARPRVSRILG